MARSHASRRLTQSLRVTHDDGTAWWQTPEEALRDGLGRLQAAEFLWTALALAEQLGMRPLQAHCHRGLGLLCQRKGDSGTAVVEVAAARGLFRAMDMNFWLQDPD